MGADHRGRFRAGAQRRGVDAGPAPEGWFDSLRAALRERASVEVERLVTSSHLPLVQLSDCFTGGVARDLRSLLSSPFAGQCAAVLEVSAEGWPAWRALLADLEQALRVTSLLARPRLLVSAGTAALSHPAPVQPGLVQHRWNAASAPLDMRLYAAVLFEDTGWPAWQRRLAAAIAAELAVWDPELCEFYRRLKLADLLDPFASLQRLANDRGWLPMATPLSEEDAWCAGRRHECDGRAQDHSAWLAVRNDRAALAQRVWNAEVGVLFPMLERHRHGLIARYGRRLSVPHQPPSGERIEEVRDLEFAHMAVQWRNAGDLRQPREFALWLRDIRNCVAHGEPVLASVLLNPTWRDRFDRPEV